MDKKKKAEVEKMTKEILTTLTLPLNTNFLVMAANSVQKSKMPCLPEEKSTSEINLPPPTIVHVRHCKSTGSVMNTKQKSKVGVPNLKKNKNNYPPMPIRLGFKYHYLK